MDAPTLFERNTELFFKKKRKKHGISKFSNSWEISGCDFWNCNVALFSVTVQGDSEYTPVAISKAHSCFNCLDLQIKSKAEEGNSFMACVVCELLHASTAACLHRPTSQGFYCCLMNRRTAEGRASFHSLPGLAKCASLHSKQFCTSTRKEVRKTCLWISEIQSFASCFGHTSLPLACEKC